MNSRKFISSVSALAIAASAFAGLAITASATETKTTIYSNDFETSSDFTTGGKTDGTTYNPGTSAGNTKGSQIIGVGSASGDASLTSPSFTALEAYDNETTLIDVSFDFKIDACVNSKSSNIALLGGESSSAWLNSDKQILTISASTIANSGGNGYFLDITVNGTSYLDALKETGTYEVNSLNRDTTGWVTLNARVNLTNKTVTYSMTKGTTEVAKEVKVSFVNTDTTQLDRIFLAAGKTYGGVYIDNVVVQKVVSDEEAETHNVTFTEKNGVSAKVTVDGLDATNGVVLENGDYSFTATAEGYKDYTGSFTVAGADLPVEYEMTAKDPAGAITVSCKANGTVIKESTPDLTGYYAEDNYTYYYPAYILYNGDYYKATSSTYGAEVTLDTNEHDYEAAYTKVEDVTIVSFTEGEDADENQNSASGYEVNVETNTRYSNGVAKSTQGTGSYFSVNVTIPADGNYTFSGPLYNPNEKSRKVDIYIDEIDDTMEGQVEVASGASSSFSVDADLTAGTHTFIFYCDYSLTPMFDYLLVTQNSTTSVDTPATATIAHVKDFTSETDTDTVASVWELLVTAGTDTITSVDVKVGEQTSTGGITTEIAAGSPVTFGVVINKLKADVTGAITAVINGEDVETTTID